MWHVSSRSDVATLRTAVRSLLTLVTYVVVRTLTSLLRRIGRVPVDELEDVRRVGQQRGAAEHRDVIAAR